jgi:uncharacterized cupredoxin-like copper-binding protein
MRGIGKTSKVRSAINVFVLVAGLVLVACGDNSTSEAQSGGSSASGSTPTVAPAGTTVAVTLEEFAVSATPSSAPAGNVTFDVSNTGPDDVHEFVVIRTDLSLIDLPTDEDGAVVEGQGDLEVIDEVEDLEVGASQELTVELTAGSYVLVCNIVQTEPDGTIEAHYAEGMRTSFTVA